jgi:hypothetical protein
MIWNPIQATWVCIKYTDETIENMCADCINKHGELVVEATVKKIEFRTGTPKRCCICQDGGAE